MIISILDGVYFVCDMLLAYEFISCYWYHMFYIKALVLIDVILFEVYLMISFMASDATGHNVCVFEGFFAF